MTWSTGRFRSLLEASRESSGSRLVRLLLVNGGFAGLIVWAGAPVAQCARIPVDPAPRDSTHHFARLLAQAEPGDSLMLAPGLYRGAFVLPIGVSLVGIAGPDSTVLDADGGRYVLFGRNLDSTTVITGLTLQNGRRDHPNSGGGGIYLHRSSPVVVNNVFRNHLGYLGPGVYTNYFCDPVIAFNVFHDNEGYLGGAIAAYERCNPLVYNNVIYGNRAVSGGAILCMNSAPVILHNTMVSNQAEPGGGGALYCDSSPALVSNNIFAFNRDPKPDGGAVYCIDDDRPATFRDNVVWENQGGEGGGRCDAFAGQEGNCSEDPGLDAAAPLGMPRTTCRIHAGAGTWNRAHAPQVPDSVLAGWRIWRRRGGAQAAGEASGR